MKIRFLIVFIVFCLIIISSYTNLFHIIELKLNDTFFLLRNYNSQNNDIVIITIDNDTYDSFNIPFPYPRKYYAHLIDNLVEAEAKLIIFDFEFDIPSNLGGKDDSIFANSVKNAGNVILLSKIVNKKNDTHTNTELLMPISILEKSALSVGAGNIISDIDGFIRRYAIYFPNNDTIINSLAYCAFSKYKDDYYEIPLKNKNTFIINYPPIDYFEKYSMWTVIDDEDFEIPETETSMDIDAFEFMKEDSVFYNKIVFIGMTLQEFHDYHYTPLYMYGNRRIKTSGVEIHAAALLSLINKNVIKEIKFVYIILVLVLFSFFIFVFRFRLIFNIVIMIFLIIFIYVFSFLLFNSKNLLISPFIFQADIFLLFVGNTVYSYIISKKEKRFITGIFGHYIPDTFVKELIKSPEKLKLGGEKRNMTIFFSDIEGFTSISEKLKPEELVHIMNIYLGTMTDIIIKNNGTLDKYIGDAIMAFFGAPLYIEDHAYMAVKSALEMQKKLKEMEKRKILPKLKTRIGINSGNMIVGNMGSLKRMNYTVMGDNVNLASRLESINKVYGTYIIITETTYELIKNRVFCRKLDKVRVKGKKEIITIYEVIDFINNIDNEERKNIEDFEIALKYYFNGEFEKAKEIFMNFNDNPSKVFIKRIESIKEIDNNWDGVFDQINK